MQHGGRRGKGKEERGKRKEKIDGRREARGERREKIDGR